MHKARTAMKELWWGVYSQKWTCGFFNWISRKSIKTSRGQTDEGVKHPVTCRLRLLAVLCARCIWCGVSWHYKITVLVEALNPADSVMWSMVGYQAALIVTDVGTPLFAGPYKTRIGTYRHIGAFFYADRILDFNLWTIRPNASNFSLFSHISAVVGCPVT